LLLIVVLEVEGFAGARKNWCLVGETRAAMVCTFSTSARLSTASAVRDSRAGQI
jgi:hypothetical protein